MRWLMLLLGRSERLMPRHVQAANDAVQAAHDATEQAVTAVGDYWQARRARVRSDAEQAERRLRP